MNQFIIIKTTFANKYDALKMAHYLLEKKLIACAQIEKITSIYSFKNQIHEDEEFSLNLKTKEGNFKQIQQEIEQNHPYELPQIISIKIEETSLKYQNWLDENIV